MIKNMTLIIDEKRIPIRVDLNELRVTHLPETIQIGGESDEEFSSRRNSFLRWALGLPKVRKEAETLIVPRLHIDPLMIITEEMKFFRSWPLDLFPLKNDCIICSLLNEKDYVKLVGCFPVDFNGDKLLMMYDLWEEHGDIFKEEELDAA